MTLHTVAEAAAYLNLHPSVVYTMIRKGQLGHHRVGPTCSDIRISEADIAAYLDATRVGERAPKRAVVVNVPDLMSD